MVRDRPLTPVTAAFVALAAVVALSVPGVAAASPVRSGPAAQVDPTDTTAPADPVTSAPEAETPVGDDEVRLEPTDTDEAQQQADQDLRSVWYVVAGLAAVAVGLLVLLVLYVRATNPARAEARREERLAKARAKAGLPEEPATADVADPGPTPRPKVPRAAPGPTPRPRPKVPRAAPGPTPRPKAKVPRAAPGPTPAPKAKVPRGAPVLDLPGLDDDDEHSVDHDVAPATRETSGGDEIAPAAGGGADADRTAVAEDDHADDLEADAPSPVALGASDESSDEPTPAEAPPAAAPAEDDAPEPEAAPVGADASTAVLSRLDDRDGEEGVKVIGAPAGPSAPGPAAPGKPRRRVDAPPKKLGTPDAERVLVRPGQAPVRVPAASKGSSRPDPEPTPEEGRDAGEPSKAPESPDDQ
ncbi:MAG: hypothetical protein ACR2JF_16085 [Iamia sp.]